MMTCTELSLSALTDLCVSERLLVCAAGCFGLLLLTLTVISRLISLDVAGMMLSSFIHSASIEANSDVASQYDH